MMDLKIGHLCLNITFAKVEMRYSIYSFYCFVYILLYVYTIVIQVAEKIQLLEMEIKKYNDKQIFVEFLETMAMSSVSFTL